MCESVHSWATQPVRKLITLRMIYYFTKPPTTVAGVNTVSKNRLKSQLNSGAYLVTTILKTKKNVYMKCKQWLLHFLQAKIVFSRFSNELSEMPRTKKARRGFKPSIPEEEEPYSWFLGLKQQNID